jgi:hypothetical protein
MDEKLRSVKDRISERYLGKDGIHSVGLRRSANAITVYVAPTEDANQEELQERTLENLRRDAAPFAVVKKAATRADFA